MADNNVKQNSSLIVEVLPEIRARILNGKNWTILNNRKTSIKQKRINLRKIISIFGKNTRT